MALDVFGVVHELDDLVAFEGLVEEGADVEIGTHPQPESLQPVEV